MKNWFSIVVSILVFTNWSFAQEVELFRQLNGRYDYTAIGKTLNIQENGPFAPCEILTSSSAELSLNEDDNIIAAYLYWAGSGNGDFDVVLNGVSVSAQRTFNDAIDENRTFFAAFAEITDQIKTEGSGIYTLSELDLTEVIANYCPTGTNFGGWAIAIIYENTNLPLNQINIYDGLESVPESLSITLENLNVLDNENAKIGFIAWEGDSALAVTEQLSINGTILSNPPLNPADNAFNGTNSFTNSSDLFNMDLDVYNIQNNINIGDSSASISLTSGQDFVMINTVVTVLNSQLPDATISIDEVFVECGDLDVEVAYTVYNLNSTDTLPDQVPIAFYIDNQLIGSSTTSEAITIGGQLSGITSLAIPPGINPVNLKVVVDDIGDGTGIVTEINEDNNDFSLEFELLEIPETILLDLLTACNEGFEKANFNLLEVVLSNPELDPESLRFYKSEEDANSEINEINDPSNYVNDSNPETIILREESDPCYLLYKFDLNVENCPPEVPEGFSPNGDGKNDIFNIKGLYDVFLNHELFIYNRNGTLIFKGDNNLKWNGSTNRGLNNLGRKVPVGTYYYVLNLNDPENEPISGWVYINY